MGRAFTYLGMVLLLAGGVFNRPAALAVGSALCGVAVVSWGLSRLSTVDLVYSRIFSSKTAFFGESVDVSIRLENRKPLPVALSIADEVPREWELPGETLLPHAGSSRAVLEREVPAGAFETVIRNHALSCTSRGIFSFGPAAVASRDPFGLFPVSRPLAGADTLVVYPRIVPVDQASVRHLYPFGDARSPSWVFQDPVEPKTSRDYMRGDPARFLDWRATARTGQLKTRLFDATFGHRAVVCLNLNTSSVPWEGTDGEAFEALVTAAASLVWDLSGRGLPVGLCTNGVSRPEEGDNYLAQCPPASGRAQLRELLVCLAGLGYYTAGGFSKACSRAWVTASGAYPLVLTAMVDEDILSFLEGAHRSNRCSLLVLPVARGAAPTGEAMAQAAQLCQGRAFLAGLEGGWRDASRLTLSPLV